MPVFICGSKTNIWKKKERSRIKSEQMDHLRALQNIRGMNKVPNARIWELCGVMKGVVERIDEGTLRWLAMCRD